jgi:hypothetical protein
MRKPLNMKKILFLLLILISCKKESDSFIQKYQSISGHWAGQTMSYDSLNVRATKPLSYFALFIYDNLTYKIRVDTVDLDIENGTIKILSQSNDKLVMYFNAKYPDLSSYAGSHLFGILNVELVSLTNDQLILKSVNDNVGTNQNHEFTFIRPVH